MTSLSVERRRAGELIRFRVYPDEETRIEFYRVRVFRSPRQLRLYAANRKYNPLKVSDDCLGLCSSWHRIKLERGRIKTNPECGEILLVADYIGARTVSHEVTHAALAHARRKKWNLSAPDGRWVGPGEESVCYAVGDMCAQIYRTLREARIGQ